MAEAERFSLVCEAGAPRLDAFLVDRLPHLSRSRLQALIRTGRVRVDGAPPAKTGQSLAPGARIEVEIPPPSPSGLAAEDIPLDVRFEDAHLLVVNKPPGVVVHPGAGRRKGTLAAALLHHCRGALSGIGGVERPGIVHRLDKDTSGLLIVAKSDPAHRRLSADLKARRIRRGYLALVRGSPDREEGTVDAPIGRHTVHRSEMAVRKGGRRAVTRYRVRERFVGAALLEVSLETGRTHQIRVHLRHIGLPVLGDPVYGAARLPSWRRGGPRLAEGSGVPIARQALHAFRLHFPHPISGEAKAFEAGPPEDFLAALAALREGA
ncbi:MAG: RluA family pseudouridine synthase [bacterium]